MCLQLCSPTTEEGASTPSEGSLHPKYENALKTVEQFSWEVRRTIDGTFSQSPSDVRNPLRHLLQLDEEYINTHVLQQYINKLELQTLLSQYFTNTQNAFELCVRLLKSTHQARISYRVIQDINFRLQPANFDLQEEECRRIREEFVLFVEQENPFGQAVDFDEMCNSLEELDQLPELRHGNKYRCCWVAEKQSAQLVPAARGIYMVKHHLKSTRMLVARMHDKVEHTKTIMRIWLEREDEVYSLLGKNDSEFGRSLDEIEEQGCLCLHNINRARMLLLQIHR